ncbi:MAG: ribosomal protein S18-alanine N-acetyltransferase [Euryarchaeota archaeon]|nr:ribosomal protein S18-alanine N-acetyltransferase [Euryarchaeota archaeon]
MFHIREFREEDVYDVFVISAQSLTEMYSLELFIDIHLAWPSGFLVAVTSEIVGFIAGAKMNGTARILMLAVAPQQRRKGIGSTLLRRFIHNARQEGLRSVSLEVRTGNKRAIEFYQKHGFQIVSMLNNYYTNGDSAYVMWKNI